MHGQQNTKTNFIVSCLLHFSSHKTKYTKHAGIETLSRMTAELKGSSEGWKNGMSFAKCQWQYHLLL